MPTSDQTNIRRRDNGAIDSRFYQRRARSLRAEAFSRIYQQLVARLNGHSSQIGQKINSIRTEHGINHKCES